MTAIPKRRYTLEEYFQIEESGDVRHEYFDGELFEMEAASFAHQQIQSRIAGALIPELRKKGCEVWFSGARVATSHKGPKGLYTYPDIVIVCGQPSRSKSNTDTLVNPKILIEILSPATRKHGGADKFALYRNIDSLSEYVTVDQSFPAVTHHRRIGGKQWSLVDLEGLDAVLRLESAGIELPLSIIYDGIEFPPERPWTTQ